MVWLVIALILLLLLAVLLITRICIEVDTTAQLYRVSWGRVLSGSILPAKDDLFLQLFVFGYKRKFSVVKLLAKPRDKKPEKEKKKSSSNSIQKFSWQTALSILKSFKVRKFHLNVDFNNAIWNAWFYPFGYFISKYNFQCTTNFEGRNELTLEIVNRPIWLVYQFIKTRIKNT